MGRGGDDELWAAVTDPTRWARRVAPAGARVVYAVRPEELDAATRRMAEVAAEWDARPNAIKRLAEERQEGRDR
jgi:hypothetical protein